MSNDTIHEESIDFDNLRRIRIMNLAVSAGYGTPLDGTEDDDYEFLDIPEKWAAGTIEPLGYRVSGDSMFPEIKHRDLLLLETHESAVLNVKSGEFVVADYNGSRTCKEIFIAPNGEVWLKPKNSKYPPQYVDSHDAFFIIGVVKLNLRWY